MTKLTRREIIEEINNQTGLGVREGDQVLDIVIQKIFSSLASGCGVEIRGLGSFTHILCKPRVGRNPLDPKKDIPIPHRYKIKFNPGRDLKAKLLKLSKQIPREDGNAKTSDKGKNKVSASSRTKKTINKASQKRVRVA